VKEVNAVRRLFTEREIASDNVPVILEELRSVQRGRVRTVIYWAVCVVVSLLILFGYAKSGVPVNEWTAGAVLVVNGVCLAVLHFIADATGWLPRPLSSEIRSFLEERYPRLKETMEFEALLRLYFDHFPYLGFVYQWLSVEEFSHEVVAQATNQLWLQAHRKAHLVHDFVVDYKLIDSIESVSKSFP